MAVGISRRGLVCDGWFRDPRFAPNKLTDDPLVQVVCNGGHPASNFSFCFQDKQNQGTCQCTAGPQNAAEYNMIQVDNNRYDVYHVYQYTLTGSYGTAGSQRLAALILDPHYVPFNDMLTPGESTTFAQVLPAAKDLPRPGTGEHVYAVGYDSALARGDVANNHELKWVDLTVTGLSQDGSMIYTQSQKPTCAGAAGFALFKLVNSVPKLIGIGFAPSSTCTTTTPSFATVTADQGYFTAAKQYASTHARTAASVCH